MTVINQSVVGSRLLSRTEFSMLVAFLFFLPLAEAPKNVLLFSFLIFWAYRSSKTGQWGRGNRWFEWPLLGIFLASVVAVFFRSAGYLQALSNCVDFLTIASLMIIAARSRMSCHQSYLVVLATFSGILFSVLYGALLNRPFPSLHSVGHINHVAIYLGIACVWVAAAFYSASYHRHLWAFGITFVVLVTLVSYTESRNALFGIILTIGLLPLMDFCANVRSRSFFWALGLVCSAGLLFLYQPPAVKRQLSQSVLNHSVIDDARQSLWRSSWVVAKSAPPFGYGVGFFSEAHSPDTLRGLVSTGGVKFSPDEYVWTSHAHNLILNWLVERGWFATPLFGLWATFVALVFLREDLKLSSRDTTLFSARTGFAVLLSTFVMGFGNTTWHHEHGLLAALFIGLSWAGIKSHVHVRQPKPD